MNTDIPAAPADGDQAKTVSDKVLERFLDELSQQPDMADASKRLREVFFSGETINDASLRRAIFNENDQ